MKVGSGCLMQICNLLYTSTDFMVFRTPEAR